METVTLTSEQFDDLITAIYGVSERLNTIITDSHNFFYFALVVIVFYGMCKLINAILEPLAIDY